MFTTTLHGHYSDNLDDDDDDGVPLHPGHLPATVICSEPCSVSPPTSYSLHSLMHIVS